MTKRGRPPVSHPRSHGVFVRFSDTEWGALQQALARDHPVSFRRPNLPEWIRDLIVAHASEVLQVEVWPCPTFVDTSPFVRNEEVRDAEESPPVHA
jgi:hypothetical protein